MSKPVNEPKNFLARWSARKLARRAQTSRHDVDPVEQSGEESGSAVDSRSIAETHPDSDMLRMASFDPASLPPLDSIGADSNIAAFLRREVPADLTRAALRRAWTSDPAIKNFVGPVENGWDFNDPSAMTGFGPISAEEVARLAGKVIETSLEGAVADQTKNAPTTEKKSQLASSDALPEEPPKILPKTAEPESGASDDAAQQSRKGDKT